MLSETSIVLGCCLANRLKEQCPPTNQTTRGAPIIQTTPTLARGSASSSPPLGLSSGDLAFVAPRPHATGEGGCGGAIEVCFALLGLALGRSSQPTHHTFWHTHTSHLVRFLSVRINISQTDHNSLFIQSQASPLRIEGQHHHHSREEPPPSHHHDDGSSGSKRSRIEAPATAPARPLPPSLGPALARGTGFFPRFPLLGRGVEAIRRRRADDGAAGRCVWDDVMAADGCAGSIDALTMSAMGWEVGL
jgi:hypothetical protein